MADDRQPEEYLILGNLRSPGVVTLTGHDREKRWNVKSAKGQEGASMTLDGDDPGQFQASFYLTDSVPDDGGPTDVALWEDFQKLIESTTPVGGKPTALPIVHPDLLRNRYTSVVNAGVSGCLHDGKGGRTYQVKFREYVPPKPKPVQKAAAKPSQQYAANPANDVIGTGTRESPKNDPNADAKRELAELTNQARQP
jgi:hypothetical protein